MLISPVHQLIKVNSSLKMRKSTLVRTKCGKEITPKCSHMYHPILIGWTLIFKSSVLHLGPRSPTQTLPPKWVIQEVTEVHSQDGTLKMLTQH